MGKIWEGGRERDGTELVEYWERRFLEACDIGRGSVLRRVGGDVINGGREGWFGLPVGDVTAGGDVAGDELGDIIAVMMKRPRTHTGLKTTWRGLVDGDHCDVDAPRVGQARQADRELSFLLLLIFILFLPSLLVSFLVPSLAWSDSSLFVLALKT
jgi:hypothetical protein